MLEKGKGYEINVVLYTYNAQRTRSCCVRLFHWHGRISVARNLGVFAARFGPMQSHDERMRFGRCGQKYFARHKMGLCRSGRHQVQRYAGCHFLFLVLPVILGDGIDCATYGYTSLLQRTIRIWCV